MSPVGVVEYGCKLCNRMEAGTRKRPPRGCGVYRDCMKPVVPEALLDDATAKLAAVRNALALLDGQTVTAAWTEADDLRVHQACIREIREAVNG